MTTKVMTDVANSPTIGGITPRRLGTLGMAGAPFLFLEGAVHGFNMTQPTPLGGFLELFYLGGWMASIFGLGMLQATGRGKGGKVVLGLQMLGLTLATIFSVFNIVLPDLNPDSLLYIITDMAWPFSHILMLVVGVAVLRAQRLSGWTRFAPLACGLAIPLLITAAIIGGREGMIVFGPYTWVAFTLLGYAVRTGDPTQI